MRQEAVRYDSPVKKGDTVMIITGKEKGKTGRVIEVLRKKQRVLVEKLNMVKRHARPTQKNRQGGIVEKESPIHWSNVKTVTLGEMPSVPKGKKKGKEEKTVKKTKQG